MATAAQQREYRNKHPERFKEYHHRHYLKRKPSILAANRKKAEQLRQYLRALKRRPCADCSQTYPFYVMDFDHRPGETKLYHPNTLPSRLSWRKLLTEVAKCDVVCSNCHRIRTHERRLAQNPGASAVPE